jgi:hypothetical protein
MSSEDEIKESGVAALRNWTEALASFPASSYLTSKTTMESHGGPEVIAKPTQNHRGTTRSLIRLMIPSKPSSHQHLTPL